MFVVVVQQVCFLEDLALELMVDFRQMLTCRMMDRVPKVHRATTKTDKEAVRNLLMRCG